MYLKKFFVRFQNQNVFGKTLEKNPKYIRGFFGLRPGVNRKTQIFLCKFPNNANSLKTGLWSQKNENNIVQVAVANQPGFEETQIRLA